MSENDDSDQFPDPVDRLRAADPAGADGPADLSTARARVVAETRPSESNVVPLRSRRAVLAAGAVAAGVALLAGGLVAGVALGRSAAPVAEGAPPVAQDEVIPVVGPASPALPSVGPNGGAGAALADSEAAMATDKAMIYPGWGTTLLPAPDLANEPGTAAGYRLVSDGIDGAALTELLADTFAVVGPVREEEYGGWTAGTADGPSVWVGTDAMVSWSYWNPDIQTWDCAVVEPMPADDEAGAVGDSEPIVPEECLPDAPPPGTRDAVREAKKLLAGLGVTDQPAVDTSLEWEASSDDWSTWVTAWQLVEGQRTQLSWSFSFTAEGLMSANGFAAGLEQVPAYPIVGARTAVLRSSDPKYAAFGPTPLDGGGVYPMAEARDTDAAAGSVTADATTDVPAGDPDKVQLWWDPAVVTGAEPTLAQYWQPDGTLLVLPAYRLTTASDRGTWAVIAVADGALEFVAPR